MDTHGEDMLDIETLIDFRSLVMDSLDELKLLNKEKSFKFHIEQCKSLSRYILDKLAPYIENNGQYLRGDVWSKSVQRAWKEIYRAMKEAETYLKHCSTDRWWMKCFILANTGEAFALHMHNLAWSLLCLDLALLCPNEEWNDRIHLTEFRKTISDFYAEMSDLHLEQFGSKFQDYWHLLKACNQAAAKPSASKTKNNIGFLEFMERKLLKAIRKECNIESATGIPTCLQIHPKDLVKKKRMGEGSFGEVYEGSWLGHKVAVKDIPIDARDLFDRETAVLAKLQSPFIVQFIGTCVEGSHCYIVMELVSSSLDKLLTNSGRRAPLPLPVAVDIMLQISRGMEYLHRQGIMDMDLKASNVLIQPSAVLEFREQGYGRVKLYDFGKASLRLSGPRCEELLQEIDTLNEYTHKADVYSFAMICYEILTGKQPFLGAHPKDLRGGGPILQTTSCPAVLADYIGKCWETDPRRRPDFAQVSTFMRNMKLFILRWNDPRDWLAKSDGNLYSPEAEVSLELMASKEEAFDESSVDEKLKSISRVLHIVPPEIKRLFCASVDDEDLRRIRDGFALDLTLVAELGLLDRIRRQRSGPLKQCNREQEEFLEDSKLGFSSFRTVYLNLVAELGLLNRIRRQRSGLLKQFSLTDLSLATGGFSEDSKLGSGSFGKVYLGTLPDGHKVAIKRGHTRNAKKKKENESAFESELCCMNRLHHKHLVGLVGYCEEEEELLLVKEYMPNGSLHDHLHNAATINPPLDSWAMRIKIALHAARGIDYLHTNAVPPIIHRNMKSSNILLDGLWNAKVSDFGLSLEGPIDEESHISLMGPMDEEYCRKSDIYSYGIVLMELLTGKKAIHKHDDSGEPRNVVEYALPYILDDDLPTILDDRLPPPRPYEIEAVTSVGYTAMNCVDLEGKDQPSTTEIVASLQTALEFCSLAASVPAAEER